MRFWICTVILALIPIITLAAPTDAQVKQNLIKQSINFYLSNYGNCPCPYNFDRAGHRCGNRSAWARPGGYPSLCYPSDVTPDMIQQYREDASQ